MISLWVLVITSGCPSSRALTELELMPNINYQIFLNCSNINIGHQHQMFLHQVDWWGEVIVKSEDGEHWLLLSASLSQLYWNISWQRDVPVALKQQQHWGNSSVPLAYKLPRWITALKSQLEEIHVNIRAQQAPAGPEPSDVMTGWKVWDPERQETASHQECRPSPIRK